MFRLWLFFAISLGLVVAAHLAVDNLIELVADKLLADGRNMVGKHMAFEMVVFMLNHTSQITLDYLIMGLKILVEPGKVYFLDTRHALVNSGQA